MALAQGRAQRLWAARPESAAAAGELAGWVEQWVVAFGLMHSCVQPGRSLSAILSLHTTATLWVLRQQRAHEAAAGALGMMRFWLSMLARAGLSGAGIAAQRAGAWPSAPTQLALCLEAVGVAAAATMAGGLEAHALEELAGGLLPQLMEVVLWPACIWQGLAGVGGALASALGAAEAAVRLAAQLVLGQQLGLQGGAAGAAGAEGSAQLACVRSCLAAAALIVEIVAGQGLGPAAAEGEVTAVLCLHASVDKLALALARPPAAQFRAAGCARELRRICSGVAACGADAFAGAAVGGRCGGCPARSRSRVLPTAPQ